MASSNIEWTESTWNPVVGCTKVSPGCANCYAETMSGRLAAMAYAKEEKDQAPSSGRLFNYTKIVRHKGNVPLQQWNNKVVTVNEALAEPLRWKKPRRIFVCSMSDLFHQDVPFDYIDQVFAVMALTPKHTYQVLTKRPERMAEYLAALTTPDGPDPDRWDAARRPFYDAAKGRERERIGVVGAYPHWPLPNVWLGTSVENQAAADERIPHLLRCPAAVRFLSCEPLLGEVELVIPQGCRGCNHPGNVVQRATCPRCGGSGHEPTIHWVIAGGESGHGARSCNIDWIRSLVGQCKAAGVPCFVKQLGALPSVQMVERVGGNEFTGMFNKFTGAWPPEARDEDAWVIRIKDKKGGNPDEWPSDLRVREFPDHFARVGKKAGDA